MRVLTRIFIVLFFMFVRFVMLSIAIILVWTHNAEHYASDITIIFGALCVLYDWVIFYAKAKTRNDFNLLLYSVLMWIPVIALCSTLIIGLLVGWEPDEMNLLLSLLVSYIASILSGVLEFLCKDEQRNNQLDQIFSSDGMESNQSKNVDRFIQTHSSQDVAVVVGKDDTCSICLEEFSSSGGNQHVQLDCNHLYHKKCMEDYIFSLYADEFRCPLCNSTYSLIE